MSKLKEHISHLTQVMSNGLTADDFQFSDAQVYFVLRNARVFLLDQKLNEGKYVSPYNFQTIPCLKLENKKIEDCECFTTDCYALQSVCPIPSIISSKKGLIINGVYTVNTPKPDMLSRITLDEYRLAKYSKTMKDVKGWFIPDSGSTLYITGYDRLGAVKVTSLFNDPLEVMRLSTDCACNEDGTPLCIDPYESEFPLDDALSRYLWSLSYEDLLKISMRMAPDIKNDARPAYGTLDKK